MLPRFVFYLFLGHIQAELLGMGLLKITCIILKPRLINYVVLRTEYYHRITASSTIVVCGVGCIFNGYILSHGEYPPNAGIFCEEFMRSTISTTLDKVYSSSH